MTEWAERALTAWRHARAQHERERERDIEHLAQRVSMLLGERIATNSVQERGDGMFYLSVQDGMHWMSFAFADARKESLVVLRTCRDCIRPYGIPVATRADVGQLVEMARNEQWPEHPNCPERQPRGA